MSILEDGKIKYVDQPKGVMDDQVKEMTDWVVTQIMKGRSEGRIQGILEAAALVRTLFPTLPRDVPNTPETIAKALEDLSLKLVYEF